MSDADTIVIAIDMGTSCSAYSIQTGNRNNIEDVVVRVPYSQETSRKGPSDIAFKRGSQEDFRQSLFGFNAIKAAGKNSDKWVLFNHYKMALYKGITRFATISVSGSDGKNYDLMPVMAGALWHISSEAKRYIGTLGWSHRQIHWVITLPAQARDGAKSYMRRAAVRATMVPSFNSPHLTFAFEPEAGALCAFMDSKITPPQNVVVLDCGGGTHDFVGLRVTGLKPFCGEWTTESGGGPVGSSDIDKRFIEELSLFLSKGASRKTARGENGYAIPDLLQMIEDIKVDCRENVESQQVNISDLEGLGEYNCRDDLAELIADFNRRKGYEAIKPSRRNKIELTQRFVQSLMDTAVGPISMAAAKFVRRCGAIDAVVLIGGLAESVQLQQSIKRRLPRVRFITTTRPSTAVVCGASLLFERTVTGIAAAQISRRFRHSYGIKISAVWDSSWDSVADAHSSIIEGQRRVSDVFSRFIQKNQTIRCGSEESSNFTPLTKTQRSVCFSIYRSTALNPKLVTDRSCSKVAECTIPFADEDMKMPFGDRSIDVFWTTDTEISLRIVRRRDGLEKTMNINFGQ
eukprot:gnl/Dysnectes_brevis/1889_a2171_2250.p1 GENE.gnl/Dysnectes_brevis/1889_a2171_2250~~gnl/Dysnectes_brevis/1889_a2171_2250.p1  ORF type:complete len:574 (+),score=117.04 gnl/Dysnectes_brevis/1889_a2171_2250:60-1781(+)